MENIFPHMKQYDMIEPRDAHITHENSSGTGTGGTIALD